MPVQGFADIVDDFLADIAHQIAFAKVEEAPGKKECQNANDDQVQCVNIFVGQDLIDDVFDQPRDDDVARARKGHTYDGND